MQLTNETIEKIAHLARLALSPEEQAVMAIELAQILEWMSKLNEIDTSQVAPLQHLSTEINNLRNDEVQPFWVTPDALKNAPQAQGNYFVVPKVIENQ